METKTFSEWSSLRVIYSPFLKFGNNSIKRLQKCSGDNDYMYNDNYQPHHTRRGLQKLKPRSAYTFVYSFIDIFCLPSRNLETADKNKYPDETAQMHGTQLQTR